jgi:hypothetical protein
MSLVPYSPSLSPGSGGVRTQADRDAATAAARDALRQDKIVGGAQVKVQDIDAQIDTLRKERTTLQAKLDQVNADLYETGTYITAPALGIVVTTYASEGVYKTAAEIEALIEQYNGLINEAYQARGDAQSTVNWYTRPTVLREQGLLPTYATDSDGSGGGGGGTEIAAPIVASDVTYNVPPVKDAYFKALSSNGGAANGLPALYVSNQPTKITDANQLWTAAKGSKGMFQTWTPPSADYATSLAAGEGLNSNQQLVPDGTLQRYGFQFNYNPMMVKMTYGGVPDVDVNTLATDKFNLFSTAVFQSSISMDLTFIRLFDMTHLTAEGAIKDGSADAWPITPTAEQAREIYNKGTMYDLEFLLQTIVGLKFPTQLRGETADIGFLTGRPVELHLGKSLRYLVQLTSFGVVHTHFDERMVPLRTEVSLEARRIPDYSGEFVENGS